MSAALMATNIVPHAPELRDAVDAFNKRMRAGGSRWGFYTEPVPDWIPKRPGQPVWREYYLAVEDQNIVRGGYALKPQEWLIHGTPQIVTDWQGPFSEGAVAPKYGTLGLRMVRDMLKKRPLLYSWGHGGDEEPVVQMLRKMEWLLHPTPFCLRILEPKRFLRMNAYLRKTAKRRLQLDALAFSGLGSLGLHAMHAALRLRVPRPLFAQGELVPRFDEWADALWDRAKGDYAALAVRNAAMMNALCPEHGWPPAMRLKVSRGGDVVGWALLMDTPMRADARFGDLRVGSVVDCFSALADAPYVVAAATRELARRGVDLVVSNQAHPGWANAFAANGYLILKNRRIFAASPPLKQALEPFAHTAQGLHLTNMDGHGPMAL
jgi:hypothetical protein